MKKIDSVIKFYYTSISPHDILCEMISYDQFPMADFRALAMQQMKLLTETEIDAFYHYLKESRYNNSEENALCVFRLLKRLVRELLLIREDKPKCHFQELIRWRGLTRSVGEDLPVCAFLASETEITGGTWKNFEWDLVLEHDNMQLKRIMQRGITDNHFHLFGSAPAFRLSWLNLMNFPATGSYVKALKHMEESRRSGHGHYYFKYQEDSLETMHFQAALIRVVLFEYLRWAESENQKEIDKLLEKCRRLRCILKKSDNLGAEKCKLQLEINELRNFALADSQANCVDYALYGSGVGGINHDFAGERKLLYQMLLGKVGNVQIPKLLMNWFYAYLVIKGRFYEELVQVNENVGFENFVKYNNRRRGFLLLQSDRDRMVRHAVMGTWNSGNLRNLEIRISPQMKVKDNSNLIQRYDQLIRGEGPAEILEHIYYVLHFPKVQDVVLKQKEGLTFEFRHKKFRECLQKYGNNLVLFREKAPREAARILGIDACSMEIGCRPEVFGPVFRKLAAHIALPPNIYKVRQWKITYHAGEDFLDLADGLRAIDEAVLFLDMKNGDRLGHAMALGLNVEKWYGDKQNEICISAQDYLDNVVWMFHKLMEFNISFCDTLKTYLRSEFEVYFQLIYGRFLDKNLIADMEERIYNQKRQKNIGGVRNDPYNVFDIRTYYMAWKLRGNDPILYEDGYFSNRYAIVDTFLENRHVANREKYESSTKAEILYFYYHYSADVRHAGEKNLIVEIPDIYVDGVKKVQHAMQQYIADMGICIETNPSSNYLISTINGYEEHPIRNLFNMGLTVEPEEVDSCPQMHVSINTDDKGVFHTSLENEYALMACAMEYMVNEKGERRYQRQRVYDWIDRIREFGNQQSFRE